MENSEIENKRAAIKKNQKQAYVILFAGIAIMLIAPFIFTRSWLISFKDTGPIGDTIGGITAPIVNLIAAVLVYLSFRQQLVANEIQIELIRSSKSDENARIEKELLKIHLEEIKDSIKHLSYHSIYQTRARKYGAEAVESFEIDYRHDCKRVIENSNFPASLSVVLEDIHHFLKTCNSFKHLSELEKQFFNVRMHHVYFHKIGFTLSYIDEIESELKDHEKLSLIMNRIASLLPGVDTEKL